MKKITDKQRLDWILHNAFMELNYPGNVGYGILTYRDFGMDAKPSMTYRQAIDAAIRASRKEAKP